MTEITHEDQLFLQLNINPEEWLANLDTLEQEALPKAEQRMQETFIRLGRLLFANISSKINVADQRANPVENEDVIEAETEA